MHHLARAASYAPKESVCANADLNVNPAVFVGILMNVLWLPPTGQFAVSTPFVRIYLEAMTVNARLDTMATHSSNVQSVTDPIVVVSHLIAKSAAIVCWPVVRIRVIVCKALSVLQLLAASAIAPAQVDLIFRLMAPALISTNVPHPQELVALVPFAKIKLDHLAVPVHLELPAIPTMAFVLQILPNAPAIGIVVKMKSVLSQECVSAHRHTFLTLPTAENVKVRVNASSAA